MVSLHHLSLGVTHVIFAHTSLLITRHRVPPRCRVCACMHLLENVLLGWVATFSHHSTCNCHTKSSFLVGHPVIAKMRKQRNHYRIKWQFRWHKLRVHDLRERNHHYGGFWNPGHIDHFSEVLRFSEVASEDHRVSRSLRTESLGPKVQMRMRFSR